MFFSAAALSNGNFHFIQCWIFCPKFRFTVSYFRYSLFLFLLLLLLLPLLSWVDDKNGLLRHGRVLLYLFCHFLCVSFFFVVVIVFLGWFPSTSLLLLTPFVVSVKRRCCCCCLLSAMGEVAHPRIFCLFIFQRIHIFVFYIKLLTSINNNNNTTTSNNK